MITLSTSGTALLAALATFLLFQLQLARSTAAHDLAALADVVALNASAPLAFNDANAAKTVVDALRARPEISSACIRAHDGRPVAEFSRRAGEPPTIEPRPDASAQIDGFDVRIVRAVIYDGETLGTLELQASVRAHMLHIAGRGVIAMAVVLGGALFISSRLAAKLRRGVTQPIEELAATARDLAVRADYSVRARRHSMDEIGALTDAFNHMVQEVEQRDQALRRAKEELSERVVALQNEIVERQRAEAELARAQRDLVEAARKAGQAEIASNVLHNVGNVLVSVMVSNQVTQDRTRALKTKFVRRTVELIREHDSQLGAFFHEHPKGRMVLGYLAQLGESLEQDQEALLNELASVRKNIEHIKEVVAMQQSYAKPMGVREQLPISEVIEHALALNTDSFVRHRIEVERHYEEVPEFPVDRHRVLQILTNLISNAKNALTASTAAPRRLSVTLLHRGQGIEIRVQDNGVGIAPENLTQIFQHGFTTRKNGHGFGLHSCAIAAKQLGGSLSVQSEGVGHGAIFVLTLPIDSVKG